MPPFFSEMHESLTNNMTQRGFSPVFANKLPTFFLDSLGFLQQTNIYLSNMQGYFDDYCIQAAFLKLHPVSQFLVFDEMGIVRGITKSLF